MTLHPSCPQCLYKDGDHSGPVHFFVCPDTRIHHPRKMNRANPEKKIPSSLNIYRNNNKISFQQSCSSCRYQANRILTAATGAKAAAAAPLLPPPAAQGWAEALPASSTAPAERLRFGAPCKQATNSALPGSAGGGILFLHWQYMVCRVRWESPKRGGRGWSGLGLPRGAWIPTRVKSTGS